MCIRDRSCLNDQELPQREREFRTDYQVVDYPQPEIQPDQHFGDGSTLATSGVVLLVGSMGLLYFSLRNQSKTSLLMSLRCRRRTTNGYEEI